MMSKQDPFVGGVIVLAVVELMSRRDSRIIQRRNLRRQKRTVVSISDGQNAQHNQQQWHGAQHGLPADGIREQVGPERDNHATSPPSYSLLRRGYPIVVQAARLHICPPKIVHLPYDPVQASRLHYGESAC